jgi:radical SAM superfamily enzyme YgiQ (UPF0313 family)
MRVLFVSANRAEINMRTMPLGMASVAAAARRAGHEALLLDLMAAPDPDAVLAEAVAAFRPELIGVSLRNIDDQKMRGTRFILDEEKRVVESCRALSPAPIVLGGAGYSIFPESALAYLGADMGIQGEGERAFALLLTRLARGQDPAGVPGLCLPGKGQPSNREFVADLDQLDLPEPDLFPAGAISGPDAWFPVQTRRGCPLGCSYCSTAAIEGRTIRRRSPRAVVEWMARLKAAGAGSFHFVDNTFNLPYSYALTLCEELDRASLGVKWRCILYPHKMDEPLAAAMARAGCREASVGFESGCERILKSMNKRFGKDDVRRTCQLLRDHGIRRLGFLLLGGPGETRESVMESLKFADSLNLDFLKISIGIRVYPYTPLAELARKQGIIAPAADLLRPSFYLTPGLEDWLRDTVAKWTQTRPAWAMDR